MDTGKKEKKVKDITQKVREICETSRAGISVSATFRSVVDEKSMQVLSEQLILQ